MSKVLCLGEVALHNLTEYWIREGYITSYHRGCPNGFDFTTTYNLEKGHRIYDKKYLLFCLVLFDKIITTSPSMFVYDKLVETGIIDRNFYYRDMIGKEIDIDSIGEKYYREISVDFIRNNKKAMVNYLSKDILHNNRFYSTVNPEYDYELYLEEPCMIGIQKHFNPNVAILREIYSSMTRGLILSKRNDFVFYNGRLSYKNKQYEMQNNFDKYANYILQLDLTPEINRFPLPQNMIDVLYLRKRPEIVSFREVFFYWVDCIAKGEINIATKIKKDVISANNALEKYRDYERKKTNLFYCTIDAIAGQIPYLSNLLSAVSPYSTRKTLKEKNSNSWVSLLK